MKKISLLLFFMAVILGSVNAQKLTVPLGGNSWITKHSKTGKETITDKGWQNWTESDTIFSTYIYLANSGNLVVSAVFNVPNGESKIDCAIENVVKSLSISGANESKIGEWKINKAGYVRIDIRGSSKTGAVFANIQDLLISGSAVNKETAFVKNNQGNFFHWGRRGPSVHLNYDTSQFGNEIEYFYNEIIVPTGNDVIGSYFMANGFGEGYFGMQVNSATERRVLFSVWSPFQTDDPSEIPPDKKIIMLKKGKDVVIKEFGNEGSGGQSYLLYNWKAGETYRFLLRGVPATNNYTNYTAWFFADGNWRLIASFSRPATNTYLKRLHSFLENFNPETGNITRKAYYQNQWVQPKNGKWKQINKAKFTYDNTASQNYRIDYSGGVEREKFFLQNCGFFSESTPYQKDFSHPVNGSAPKIDLSKLE